MIQASVPRIYSQSSDCATLHLRRASVGTLKVKVHHTAIEKSLNKCGLIGRAAKNPLLSKKHMAAWIKFAKLHLNKDFWNKRDQSGDVWR